MEKAKLTYLWGYSRGYTPPLSYKKFNTHDLLMEWVHMCKTLEYSGRDCIVRIKKITIDGKSIKIPTEQELREYYSKNKQPCWETNK